MKKDNIFWGLILIMAAGLVLLDSIGLSLGIGIFRLMVGMILVAVLVKSVASLHVEGICFSAAFIIIFFSDDMGMPTVNPLQILVVALLMSAGLNLILGDKIRKIRKERRESHGHRGIGQYEQVVDSQDCDHIEIRLKFGSVVKYVESDNFVSGDLSASFGALMVYFDSAIIQNASAELFVDVSFGALKLYIPRVWKVESTTINNFAGVDEHGVNQWTEGGKILYLKGNVNFGAVEIYYI